MGWKALVKNHFFQVNKLEPVMMMKIFISICIFDFRRCGRWADKISFYRARKESQESRIISDEHSGWSDRSNMHSGLLSEHSVTKQR